MRFLFYPKVNQKYFGAPFIQSKIYIQNSKKIIWDIMGAPKTPKKHEWEYNGRTSNKTKKGAGQKIFLSSNKGHVLYSVF